jgi:hypothetical protein
MDAERRKVRRMLVRGTQRADMLWMPSVKDDSERRGDGGIAPGWDGCQASRRMPSPEKDAGPQERRRASMGWMPSVDGMDA